MDIPGAKRKMLMDYLEDMEIHLAQYVEPTVVTQTTMQTTPVRVVDIDGEFMEMAA